MEISRLKDMQEAALDFRYLLNRKYPRKAALQLVGNRHQLTSEERHLLHRGVFSRMDSESRRKKRIPLKEMRGKALLIDGYNVIITIEAGLEERPLILGDDGFIRDISGLSGNFKKTERTEEALCLILETLKEAKPNHTLLLFDAPISMSGSLAQEVRVRFKEENIPGEAQAVKVPEKFMIGFRGIIATSDTATIDQSERIVDLAGDILKKKANLKSLLRWRRKRGPLGTE